jgi:ribokinase
MKTLVFGSLNIDLLFSVDHIVRPGETINSYSLVKSAGGKGANQAAAVGKAGMAVYMAGKIGEDGRFLLTLLQSYGVNTDNVAVYEGASGQALIQVNRNTGENAIVLSAGGNGEITSGEIARTLDRFTAGDAVVLQNEIPVTGVIMKAAKQRGLRIVLNPSPFDERIATLPLELADMLFVNEIEGALLAGKPEKLPPQVLLDSITARFPNAEVILTVGKDGAYYGFQKIREKGNIIAMPVVDTTGAGDTFTGYFIASRHQNQSIHEALQTACKASSLAVSRKGAMEAMPWAKEVM